MPKRTRRKCELHEQKQADKKKKKKKGVLGCEEKNKEVLELFEMYYLFDNTCFRTCNINRYLLENQHYKH